MKTTNHDKCPKGIHFTIVGIDVLKAMVEKRIFPFLLCGNESFFFLSFSLLPALLAQSTQRGNWVLFACTDTIPFHDDVKLCKKG